MRIAGFAAGPFQTNCYVVANGDRAFVIDPGLGAHEAVSQIVQEQGLTVEAVVLTHGHIDHIRDAAAFGVETFVHPADAFMLLRGEGVSEQARQLYDASAMPPIDNPTPLEDGQTLQVAGVEMRVVHAPGHSPGCVMLVADDVVFSGDVLFRGSIGRTDLPDSDPEQMRQSLRGPVWDLADELQVLPGHGPATTVAQERATNPYLRQANADR
ncbi:MULTISPECIES: MBL fold metallo-hydrolase [unclassified Corynebacterium]|uniref:MBL fold metallo-hydrolase n=1 Tax=unclassified Corynebacterium TaxID=2624378 RepID=UPI001EF5869F|nr:MULTISPECIES: MBL fold metallo-hydrolase [unclassified Corynebacterium]MCG7288981.1 MBL fold metallo-hydrolase [Corynebacterium sp. ACRPZ]MCG7293405.1 MBL fold metallo-hydrolase [Corynebacterium sp. ACRPY]